MSVRIQVDLMPLAKCLRFIMDSTRKSAISEALTRGAGSMRREASKAIPQQARPIKQHMVNKATTVLPARASSLVAMVRAHDLHLHAFSSRARLNASTSKVGASFKPWSQKVSTAGAFKASMNGGKFTSIFVRGETKKRVGPNRSALPIFHIGWGPSVHREMVREDQPAAQRMALAGQEMFQKRVVRNVDFLTKSGKAKFGL